MAGLPENATAHQRKLHESSEPIILQLLNGIYKLSDSNFEKHLTTFFPILADLTLSDSVRVRETVRQLLLRVGKLKL